ncbi:hypothetical protein [Borreliella afzelii]|nr:hypothetical protein BAFK78_AC011 [Borreliella afzelii K78]
MLANITKLKNVEIVVYLLFEDYYLGFTGGVSIDIVKKYKTQ